MKKISILFSILFTSLWFNAQNLNHPTISGISIQYKSLPQTTLALTQFTNNSVKVVPMATITLVNASLVSAINFKVINITGAIEYQSDYILSSNIINDASGRKVFQVIGNSVFINVPREVTAGNYSFHAYTKNAANVSSPTYTLTY